MHCNDAFASKKKVMVLKLYYKSSWVQSSAIRGLVYSVLNILTRCKFRNKNTNKDNYTININFINTNYSSSSIIFVNKLHFYHLHFYFHYDLLSWLYHCDTNHIISLNLPLCYSERGHKSTNNCYILYKQDRYSSPHCLLQRSASTALYPQD